MLKKSQVKTLTFMPCQSVKIKLIQHSARFGHHLNVDLFLCTDTTKKMPFKLGSYLALN